MTSERSLSFGAVAAAYETFRPGYPDALVDLVRAYARGPIGSALEIGAGTGKATRVFARHGISVTASEPDAAMLDVLRAQVPDAEAVQSTLEELADLGPFDLVFAAASLHWTDSDRRWDQIAGLLGPGGVFACFGGAPELADNALAAAVSDAQRQWLTDDDPAGPTDVSADGMHWPATELVADARFSDVREKVIPQSLKLRKDQWVGYLSTVSAYLVLTERDRAAALAAVAPVLPDQVELRADLTVHLARRVR